MQKHIKQKRCKICKEHYTPHRTTQQVCSATCAHKHAEKLRLKKEKEKAKEHRKQVREAKKKQKTITDLANEAQVPFNAFIRYRDKDQPCISCQRTDLLKVNAGHYRTRKAAPHLRFNEDNCHLQCEHCNSFLSGNIINYRPNLIKRIGLCRVEALENNNELHKWGREELIEIKELYRLKLKELKQSEV